MASMKSELNSYGRLWRQEWIRPYESFWSIWQRYKHVNALNDSRLFADIGFRNYNKCFVFSEKYGIYMLSSFIRDELHTIFKIPNGHFDSLRLLFHLSFLESDTISFLIPHDLIYCPICLEKHSFHSYLHQLAGKGRKCPWHPDQELIRSKDCKYEISYGNKYAFENDRLEDIIQPLPPDTTPLRFLKPIKSPYKSIFSFFNYEPEENILYYISTINNKIKIIGTEDEMSASYTDLIENLARFLFKDTSDEYNHEFWEEYYKSWFLNQNNVFFAAVCTYKWIIDNLSSFDHSELVKYKQLMMKYNSDEWTEKMLPNRELVSLLRCARAITCARSFRDVNSKHLIFRPGSSIYGPYIKGINFNCETYIERKMFDIFKISYGADFSNIAFIIYYNVIFDYFTIVLSQIKNNPYSADLSNVKEPNYLVVQMEDERWGFYRLM